MLLTHRRITIPAIIVCTLAASAVFFFILRKPVANQPFAPSASPLPDVVFKNVDGQEITLASLRGHPLVVNLWASWCSLCEREIAILRVLQKKFGDGVIIIEVNRGESSEIVKTYRDRIDASHDLMFVLDAQDLLYRQTGGFSMSDTFFVDKEGMVRDHIRGSLNAVELERHIEDLISS